MLSTISSWIKMKIPARGPPSANAINAIYASKNKIEISANSNKK